MGGVSKGFFLRPMARQGSGNLSYGGCVSLTSQNVRFASQKVSDSTGWLCPGGQVLGENCLYARYVASFCRFCSRLAHLARRRAIALILDRTSSLLRGSRC